MKHNLLEPRLVWHRHTHLQSIHYSTIATRLNLSNRKRRGSTPFQGPWINLSEVAGRFLALPWGKWGGKCWKCRGGNAALQILQKLRNPRDLLTFVTWAGDSVSEPFGQPLDPNLHAQTFQSAVFKSICNVSNYNCHQLPSTSERSKIPCLCLCPSSYVCRPRVCSHCCRQKSVSWGIWRIRPRRASDRTHNIFWETSTPAAAAPDRPFEETCIVWLAEEEYQHGVIYTCDLQSSLQAGQLSGSFWSWELKHRGSSHRQ